MSSSVSTVSMIICIISTIIMNTIITLVEINYINCIINDKFNNNNNITISN